MAEYVDVNKIPYSYEPITDESGCTARFHVAYKADIDELPTVNIVRCEDCKYFEVYEGTPYCDWCGRSPNFDDFCSYGERRTDDGE